MTERRSSGLLRVPFVRLGSLRFDDGSEAKAFVVNLNILGAYIAWDDTAAVGQAVALRFGIPGSAVELDTHGVIAWLNPRQQHPVHSLPPGFGLKFLELDDETQRRIEIVVRDYLARSPQAPR